GCLGSMGWWRRSRCPPSVLAPRIWKAMLGGCAFCDHHIVHVHVGRELPAVGQEIVDHAGLVDDAQPMPLERRLELVRSDEFVPLAGVERAPAKTVLV